MTTLVKEIAFKGRVALHYVANKAGMEGNDRDKIARIIAEASKDSEYYKREELRSKQATERAGAMLRKIEEFKNLNEGRLYAKAQREVQSIIKTLE